jgi:hypothetical protein
MDVWNREERKGMRFFFSCCLAAFGIFVAPGSTAHAGEGRNPAASPQGVRQKLGRATIPEVNFRQAHIRDVVHFLSQASRNHDRNKVGVNMIWGGDAGSLKRRRPLGKEGKTDAAKAADESGVPLITFRARHISVLEALDIVTQMAGLKYRIQGNVVLVTPKSAPDGEIQVRTYTVKPTIGDRIRKLQGETGLRRPAK